MKQELLLKGFDDYLRKPVEYHELEAVFRRFIPESQLGLVKEEEVEKQNKERTQETEEITTATEKVISENSLLEELSKENL